MLSVADFVTNILTDIFCDINIVSNTILGVELYQAIFFSGSVNGILSRGADEFINEYVSSTYGGTVSDLFGWSGKLLSKIASLGNALADSFTPPNLKDIAIYNRISAQNFQSRFIVNDSEFSMEDIINLYTTN